MNLFSLQLNLISKESSSGLMGNTYIGVKITRATASRKRSPSSTGGWFEHVFWTIQLTWCGFESKYTFQGNGIFTKTSGSCKILTIQFYLKTRAELEEIALAEADVARLKQKVAELHHQLNQQRQTHFGSFSETRDTHQYLQNHNPQK